MHFTRITYTDDEANAVLHIWEGTKAGVEYRKKDLKRQGMRQIFSEEIDLPLDKTSLLNFLNTTANRPVVPL